jgi:hypothetical protein
MRQLRGAAQRIALAPILLLGFAQAARAQHAAPVDIPFALEGGNIVLQVELTPGHPLPFVFDTGLSDGNIVSAETAKALALKPNAKMAIRDANGASDHGQLVVLPSVRVGPAKLSNQPFAIVPIPDEITQRKGKPPIAGFLGAPLLKDAVVCIDYRHHTLHRWGAHDFDAAHFASVPMASIHDLPTIHVDIDGRHANLIVDSGNNGALTVYPDFAVKNDFKRRYPDLVPQGENAGGGSQMALSGEADAVEIGSDVGFRHVPLMIIPQGMDPAWGIDGMVGFVLLARLDPCLDREGKRFMFRMGGPSSTAGRPNAGAATATRVALRR